MTRGRQKYVLWPNFIISFELRRPMTYKELCSLAVPIGCVVGLMLFLLKPNFLKREYEIAFLPVRLPLSIKHFTGTSFKDTVTQFFPVDFLSTELAASPDRGLAEHFSFLNHFY